MSASVYMGDTEQSFLWTVIVESNQTTAVITPSDNDDSDLAAGEDDEGSGFSWLVLAGIIIIAFAVVLNIL